MKIHFVYAGDPGNDLNHSPFTITKNVYAALKKLGPQINYYDWCSCGPFDEVRPDDIVIGHPNYPHNTAIRQLFTNQCKAKILLFPFHHGMPWINFPFDDVVAQADVVLSITGRYWYDTIADTKFAHWRNKMVRLDMAVDSQQFPLVKTEFNPPGSRAFFHIGSDRPEKGLDFMTALFAGTSHRLHVYGMIGGDHPLASLPNVTINGWSATVPEFAKAVAEKCDCFITTGLSDANPTTLLEAASWGFPGACTPQSGYWPDNPFYGLDRNDLDGCKSLLHYVQTIPSDVLKLRASSIRSVILAEHSWDTFCDKIASVVKRYM